MLDKEIYTMALAVILIIVAVVSNIKYNKGGNDKDEECCSRAE